MKAHVVRVSDLLMETATPPLTESVILQAEDLPADTQVVHILKVQDDYWEILLTSNHFQDQSISDLYNEPCMTLRYSDETIARLRAAA